MNLGSLHDAEVIGFVSDRERKEFKVLLTGEDGARYSINLKGVVYLKVSDYTYQNIVSNLILMDSSSNIDSLRKVLSWVTEIGGDATVEQSYIDLTLSKILSGKLSVVYFVPSWGAEIAAVCEQIVLTSNERL
ncbi:hypothetical protein J3U99_21695 [Brucella pituitosa]|uniref:hypothetical protein n=1 Tax=Brucella pituitosa TaxID=571256 RepID=UPI000C276FAF|nr:hypothetical protein [Brucella pituitosa]MCK4207376.1 hypothetical protein [Brucella pituitosa]PJO48509.1 hypothetical protein CWE02_01455 [Brucella pituitosa]PRA84464.1 hypothetical protein CQ054_15450 [Ochrobactrum sp. MYb29]